MEYSTQVYIDAPPHAAKHSTCKSNPHSAANTVSGVYSGEENLLVVFCKAGTQIVAVQEAVALLHVVGFEAAAEVCMLFSPQAAALLLAAPQCSDRRCKGRFCLPDGLTPLHMASASNDLALAALLLKEDAAAELQQASARCHCCLGSAAVAFACTPPAPEGLQPTRSVSVKLPLCRACLVRARDDRGCTAAFYCGSRSMLRLLLDSGSPLDSCSSSGDTLLHALVYNARRFVDSDPAISIQAAREEEETEAAAAEGPSEVVCMCRDCGGPQGSPRGSALCRILLLLQRVQSQASISSSPTETRTSTTKTVAEFINTQNQGGWAALHLAASRGYSDVCKVITTNILTESPPSSVYFICLLHV